MLDSHERDRTKTHNEGLVGDKDVSTVGRLERDAEAGFWVKSVGCWIISPGSHPLKLVF